MNEAGNDETEKLFDSTMYSVLMIEFLREFHIPFATVNNSKFRALLHYINPIIEIPSQENLIAINQYFANNQLFKNWEKVPNSADLDMERFQMVSEWTQANAKRATSSDGTEVIQLEGYYSEDVIREMAPLQGHIIVKGNNFDNRASAEQNQDSEQNVVLNNQMTTVNVETDSLRDPKMEPIPLYEETKPIAVYEETKPVVASNLESSPISENSDIQAFEEMKESLMIGYDVPDSKPLMTNIQDMNPSYDSEPCSSSQYMNSSSANGYVYDQNFANDNPRKRSFPTTDIPEYTEKIKTRRDSKQVTTFITFPDIAGVVKWPCIVCNERKEAVKLRSVNNCDAYIMLFVCVKNGIHSLEKAKELARMQKFKVCVDHLSDMYNSLLHYLAVVDPHIDVHVDNEKIVEAYHIVKDIRDSRFVQKLVFEGSRKHILPFCTSLRNFFSKYGRSNWLSVTPGAPSLLIECSRITNEEKLRMMRTD